MYMMMMISHERTAYDTVGLRALKSWRCGPLHLAHGTETKNKEELKTNTE